jgi:hypothetical protein
LIFTYHQAVSISFIIEGFKWGNQTTAILFIATDEHGKIRINKKEFDKLTIKQKSKYPPVKIRNNPCESVAKKIKMRIAESIDR